MSSVKCDDADDAAFFAQHRDGGLGVAAQAIQTRFDLLMRQNGREMAADERISARVSSRATIRSLRGQWRRKTSRRRR